MSWESVGFLGTYSHLSQNQKTTISNLLSEHIDEIVSVHHADAVGSDADFNTLMRTLVNQEYLSDHTVPDATQPTYPHDELDIASQPTIYLHPYTPCKHRAHCDQYKRLVRVNEQGYSEFDTEVFSEQTYEESVRNIIKVSHTIIACPPCANMQPKMATWASIRSALNRPMTKYRPINIIIVPPDTQNTYYSLRPDDTMSLPSLRTPWTPVCKDTLQCFLCQKHVPSKTYYDMEHVWILVGHLDHGRHTIFYCSECKLVYDFSSPTPYRNNTNRDWVSLNTLNTCT